LELENIPTNLYSNQTRSSKKRRRGRNDQTGWSLSESEELKSWRTKS